MKQESIFNVEKFEAVSGIYMIYNLDTKKIYIGKSYLDENNLLLSHMIFSRYKNDITIETVKRQAIACRFSTPSNTFSHPDL